MADILDDIPLRVDCPVKDCPGEIVRTFGALKASPGVTCPVCGVGAVLNLSDEQLEQARASVARLQEEESKAAD